MTSHGRERFVFRKAPACNKRSRKTRGASGAKKMKRFTDRSLCTGECAAWRMEIDNEGQNKAICVLLGGEFKSLK